MDPRLRRVVAAAALVHLIAAAALLWRVLPPLEHRLAELPPMRGSLVGMVTVVALLPSVPALLVGWLSWPVLRHRVEDDSAHLLWFTGLAAAAFDTVARALAAWWQALPHTTGELLLAVLIPVDAIGRIGALLGHPLPRWAAPVGSLSLAAAVAAGCFAAAAGLERGRTGRTIAGYAGAGFAAAALVAVAVFRSAPSLSALWIGLT
jgi:hypothetical protein